MRTILLSLFFALTATLTFAQTSEHLSFKGVPIDGTLMEYVSKMKQSGFILIRTEDGVAMLEGEFAGYKDCIVGVSTLKGKDLVSKITVIFPNQKSWSPLASNYFNLKEMLIEKYGQPSKSIEKFSSFKPDDDGSKMTQVHLDACNYVTTFETDKGSIELSIKGDLSSAYVVLSYFDKINSNVIREKAKGDL